MKLLRQKLFSSLDPDVVLEFLGRLNGFISRAKSLHWGAQGKDIHEYLDGLWKELYEFQDTVAEGFMGISGQFSSDDVPYIPSEEKISPKGFLLEVESRTLEFYEKLPSDDPRYKGLTGETESFIQTIEKYKYLFGLCDQKEFSSKIKLGTRLNARGLAKDYNKNRKNKNLSKSEKKEYRNIERSFDDELDKNSYKDLVKLGNKEMTEDEFIAKHPWAAKKKYRK